MAIQPIGSINTLVKGGEVQRGNDFSTPFSAFLNAATDNLENVNNLTKEADQMSVDFALGRTDNIADVMIAQEKASVALQYTVQISNRLIEAYNEIIRIQV